jgi:hypothetical protein
MTMHEGLERGFGFGGLSGAEAVEEIAIGQTAGSAQMK